VDGEDEHMDDKIPESIYLTICAKMEQWAKESNPAVWRIAKNAAIHGFFAGYTWAKREEEKRIPPTTEVQP
jgi:hypothetical protein